MTTHDDLDRRIGDALRAEAPTHVPAELLTSAMDRVERTAQSRRGGILGGAPARLLAAAAVLVIAVVAGSQLAGLIARAPDVGASPTPMPSTAQTPEQTPEPTTPAPSATSGATPTATPEPNALLLRLVMGGGGPTHPGQLLPNFTLMTDGTVVWSPVSSGFETPSLLVRRLTPDGLAEMRERIFSSGLLDQAATHDLERRPGAPEPPGRGVVVYFFTSGIGGEPVRIESVQWLGDEEESTYYQPSAERRALDRLASALGDPEAMVGPDAWDGPAEPYVGADYQLVLTPYPDRSPSFETTDASEIPWPFSGPLDEFGEQGEIGPPFSRCGIIARSEAEAIIAALDAAGQTGIGLDRATVASLDWAEGSGTVDAFLMPRMPDGFPTCADQLR